MRFDNTLVSEKLTHWEKNLESYQLPRWELLPDLGLYMEQVVTLLKTYLSYLPAEEADPVITPAAINNYVRKKIMPMPVKKKYYRSHIAYLVMICTLKQSLTIPTLSELIPNDIPEEEVKGIYTSYRNRHRIASEYFIEQVRIIASPILHHDESRAAASVDDANDLITTYAVLSGLSGLLAEKLILLGRGDDKAE